MNRKRGIFLTGAVLIVLLVAIVAVKLLFGVPQAQAKQLMLYSFVEGQKLTQRVTMEQDIKTTIMGQQQTMNQAIGLEYDYEIIKVHADSSAEIRCTYTWVFYEQDGPAGHIEYETSTPEKNINPADEDFVGQVYGAMVGESFIINLSSDGELIDVGGVNEIYSHIADKMDIPDEVQRDQLLESMQSQFGEEAIKEMMVNWFTTYSQRPVGIGDTWKTTVKLSTGFPMIVENTYKLAGRNGDTSTIELKSKVSPNPDGKPLQSGSMTISYEIHGTQQGKIIVDATGWAVNGQLTQNFSGEMVMEGNGVNLSAPMSVESTILIETSHWE